MKLAEDIKSYFLGDSPLSKKLAYIALWIICFAAGWQTWGLFISFF